MHHAPGSNLMLESSYKDQALIDICTTPTQVFFYTKDRNKTFEQDFPKEFIKIGKTVAFKLKAGLVGYPYS